MGTRGLVGIKVNGKKKYSYNHFDSYPDGLGMDVVNFCKTVNNWGKFKKNAADVMLVSERSKPSVAIQKKYAKFCNLGVSEGKADNWYCLLHDVQGVATFEQIYNGNLSHMINSNSFIKDSLFCEYAYVINLDTMNLEMYKGFQKKGKKYLPCKLVGEFPLTDIPDDWKEKAFPSKD